MPSSFPVMGHVMGHPQCSACPCTWRSTAQTPHRAFIAATHRGTAPAQALTSAGSIGCSRQAGPPALYQHASRSEEHTSELQSLMRISYAVFCLKKKNYDETQQNRKDDRITI